MRLGSNRLGDQDATAIADALKVNGALTTLDLDYNEIGDHGATAIADALKVNGVLTTLWLTNNKIGDQGASAIGEALKFNDELKLKELWVGNVGGYINATLKAACAEKGVTLS